MKPIWKNWKNLGLILGISGLSVVGIPFSSQIADNRANAQEQSDFSAQDMTQIANQYCLACHNDALATSGLSLQNIDFKNINKNAEIFEKVVKKLRAHMMPPSGMPRPDFETYGVMTSWLESELDRNWQENPNPGRITPIHRMNRYEYNNAINSLLGIEVDVMELLPGDPTADGSFDNIASALPFTPAHMERYMSVARQVTRLATGLPPLTPGIANYEIPLYMSQDWRQNEDMPFGSRGGISVRHNFQYDGEYTIKIDLETNYQDYVKGLGWAQILDLRLDGKLLERFTIGGDAPGTPTPLSFSGTGEPGSIDWEQYMLYEATEGLEITVPVTAGPHSVTASYVRQQVIEEGIPQPRQGGRLPANNEAYLDYQKIHAIEIGGPYSIGENLGDAPSRQLIFSCYPDELSEEASCATEILTRIARKAYRRSITGNDVQILLSFFNRGREQGGSFDEGIQFALEFILSDPDFLIRSYHAPVELAVGEIFNLSDAELATRLAFFLWSSPPDEELIQVAENGALSDPQVYEQQVIRMLKEDLATKTLVEDFAAQWLNLRRLEEVNINTVLFPQYDVSLIEAFEKETEMFIGESIKTDSSIIELLNAEHTYVNERLARHYEIENVYGSRFRKETLPDTNKRGGLLAQGALLTVTSYPGRTSPVLRGKWLLDNLLGTPPPPPPPNVPILPEAEAGQIPTSIRERLAQHREDPICSSCHVVIDPLGFALENFDVIGTWREFDEVGNPVDPNGNYPGGVEFSGFTDLRRWMLSRPEQFAHTLTEKLMTYALGRRVEYYDQPVIRQIVRDASDVEYKWSSIILGIVNSPAFKSSMAPGGIAANDAQVPSQIADLD